MVRDKILKTKKSLILLRSQGYCRVRLLAFLVSEANSLALEDRSQFLKELNKFLEKQILNH